MKRLLALLLTGCLLLGTAQVAFADTWADIVPTMASMVEAAAPSAVVMEVETGTILYAKDETTARPPASVTKIMTMLLVLEAVDRGELKMDQMVTASQNAKEMGGTQINLDIGEQMTVYDLMMSVAVASANDAALALGEQIGGSESGFVTMMNRRAAELGMENTVFMNPHGLPEEGHETSALDIAKMTAALLKTSMATEFIGCETYTVRADSNPYQMRNTNKLLSTYQGCIGGKTGYTEKAGYCMSLAAERENMQLVTVVMGETDTKTRQADLVKLMDYGFGRFRTFEIPVEPVIADPIKVTGGMADTCEVQIPQIDLPPQVIEKGEEPKCTQQMTLAEELQAPVQAGQKVGEVVFTLGDQEIATFELTAQAEVAVRDFPAALKEILWKILTI